jgi:acetoin utilization protein AcuB
MLVQDIMTRAPLAIPPDKTLASTYRLMLERRLRHLPVLDGERLVGVVTDRDLRSATSALATTPFAPGARVSDVMTRDVRTARPLDAIEEAARMMRELKIGCLPVVDEDKLVGIVTGMDLLDALLALTGVDKPSSRIDVELEDKAGELGRLATFFAERRVNIHSILTWHAASSVMRTVVRAESNQMRALAEGLRAAGFKVVWPPEAPWRQ